MLCVCTHARIRLKLRSSCGEKYFGLESHSVASKMSQQVKVLAV